jgi:hypothetical protein
LQAKLRVREVSNSRKEHSDSCRLGGGDNFFISDTATWLNYSDYSAFDQNL